MRTVESGIGFSVTGSLDAPGMDDSGTKEQDAVVTLVNKTARTRKSLTPKRKWLITFLEWQFDRSISLPPELETVP
jgi:hypothetical protein